MINFKFFRFDKSSSLSIRPDVKPDDDTRPSVGESDRKAIIQGRKNDMPAHGLA